MEKVLKTKTEYGMMTVEIIDITPEIAEAMLKRNVQNRNPKKKKIRGYAREMKRELWKENGVPIIFDDEGVLKDGQHRLKAIMESKITVSQLIKMLDERARAESNFNTAMAMTREGIDPEKILRVFNMEKKEVKR